MGSTGSLPSIGTEIISSAVGASTGALIEYKLQNNDDKKNGVSYCKDGSIIDSRPPPRKSNRNYYINNNYY